MTSVPGRTVLRPMGTIGALLLCVLVILGSQAAASVARSVSSPASAKKLLLTLHDMPKGWITEKNSGGSGSNSFPGASKLANCIGVPTSHIDSNPPDAESPYFENKSGSLEVQDTVSVFPSAKEAAANFSALTNAKTPGCMTTLMNGAFKAQIQASAGEGAKLGTITVTKASLAGFPRGSTGLVMSLPITDQGVSIDARLTAVYYRKGRLGQEIDFNSYGATFPVSLAESLTATALHRL